MKKERIFETILHEAEEGGFWAECPSLRGCYAQGETIEEVKNNIQEAIELCLEELGKMKKRIPKQKRTYLVPVEVRF